LRKNTFPCIHCNLYLEIENYNGFWKNIQIEKSNNNPSGYIKSAFPDVGKPNNWTQVNPVMKSSCLISGCSTFFCLMFNRGLVISASLYILVFANFWPSFAMTVTHGYPVKVLFQM